MKSSHTDKLQIIDADTLKQWLDRQSIILIDVRERVEHLGEHIFDSISIPLSNFEPARIPGDGDKKIVLYCNSGNRSGQAAQKMFQAGFEDVAHLEGGIAAWKKAGYQTQINKKAPISIMRQVQIVAGSLVLTGTLLGAFVSPWFLILSGFVGGGLVFAGITNTCAMAVLLAKLPYNQM